MYSFQIKLVFVLIIDDGADHNQGLYWICLICAAASKNIWYTMYMLFSLILYKHFIKSRWSGFQDQYHPRTISDQGKPHLKETDERHLEAEVKKNAALTFVATLSHISGVSTNNIDQLVTFQSKTEQGWTCMLKIVTLVIVSALQLVLFIPSLKCVEISSQSGIIYEMLG